MRSFLCQRLCLLGIVFSLCGAATASALECPTAEQGDPQRTDCKPLGLKKADNKADDHLDGKEAIKPTPQVETPKPTTAPKAAVNEDTRVPNIGERHERYMLGTRPCVLPYCIVASDGRTVVVPLVVEQKTVVIQPAAMPLHHAPQRSTRAGIDVTYPVFDGGDNNAASSALNAWVAQNTASCGAGRRGDVRQDISVRAFGTAVILHDEGVAACDGSPHAGAWARDVFFTAADGRQIDLEQNITIAGQTVLLNKIAEVAMRLPPGDACREMYLSTQPLAYNFFIRGDGYFGIAPSYAAAEPCDAATVIALSLADMASFYPARSAASAVFETMQR